MFSYHRQFLKTWLDMPLKENAQTTKGSFESIIKSSKRKPKLFETNRGKELYNKIFQIF